MKILFIGGTGTISTACAARCLADGWEVTLLHRGTKPTPEGMKSIQADMADEDAVFSALTGQSFDAVADFIAYTPEDAARDIRLFSGKTKQYLFISSASAYQKPCADYRITESTPLCNPYWQYSRSKAAAEEVFLRAYRDQGFPVTILRPSHTYSDSKIPVAIHGQRGSWQVLQRILNEKPVLIPGDGTSLWTLTHAEDFARAFLGLLGNPHALGTAVHITSEESMTWNQIYSVLADAAGKPLLAQHVTSDFLAACGDADYDFTGALLGDKANTVVFDNAKLRRLVPGFVCRISMAEGIRRAVAYALAHTELQVQDPAFDRFCSRVTAAQQAALEAFGALKK